MEERPTTVETAADTAEPQATEPSESEAAEPGEARREEKSGDARRRMEARGVDAPRERRPGVPREAPPEPVDRAAWDRPETQEIRRPHLRRAGIERLTPVVGTAQPPRGASGMLRRAAYEIPEHYARHWAMLMLADRVDVLEGRLGALIGDGLRRMGLDRMADRAERNPLPVAAGTALVGWLLVRRISAVAERDGSMP